MTNYDDIEENDRQNWMWHHIEAENPDELRHDLYLGANPNTWQYMGNYPSESPTFRMMPLAYAIGVGNVECIRLLVEYGAKVKGKIHELFGTIMECLAENEDIHGATIGNINIFEYFIARGAEMISLCGIKNISAIDVLFKHGADINQRSCDFYMSGTILHDAVDDENYELVEYLLKMGADPDMRTILHHETPLHIALGFELVEMSRLLLSYKPDLTIKDEDGDTPYDVALYMEQEELIQLFKHC